MAARGGLLRLLDAYIAIGGDTSGYDAALTQAEAKAKASGNRISSLFTPSKVFAALTTAAGAAFGMALAGANQLDAATQRLQADTGMTATEAARAEKSLAGMYRNNLQGFDAIGAAMAKVHNDLGLTGAAADAATALFLKFSTATGQDAAEAVASFDDILDAWGLTAADAGSVMDKLIVSHQKFGGVISESEAALAAMAPAMTAANMSIDDGIALLNLFNASGIEVSDAAAMLQRAVKQLKPGQDMNDLIAQVAAIEDPTLRAQKAMEIFGKQGAKMASAIKPGTDSLADLTDRLGDTADATTTASDAVESSFGNQFKLTLKNASGALAEFGLNFDALIIAASVFGPKFTTTLLAGLGGLGTLLIPKITAAMTADVLPWMTTGTKIGAIMGGPLGTALGIAAVAALAFYADDIQKALGTNYDPAKNLPMDQWSWPFGPKNTPKVDILWMKNILGGDSDAGASAATGLMDKLKQLAAGNIGAGSEFGKNLATGIADGTPAAVAKVNAALSLIYSTWDKIAATLPVPADKVMEMFGGTTVAAVKKAAAHTGIEGMLALAAGVTSARQAPLDAFDAMVAMLKTPMTSTQEAARLAGELTSQSLADGLRSHDPEIHAQAIAVKREILDRLAELQTAKGIGSAAMDELNKGIASKDPEIRKAALAAKDAVLSGLAETASGARLAGADAGAAFATGFSSTLPSWLTSRILHQTGGTEGKASGGPVEAGMPYIVGEHRPEVFVPQTNGYILPSVPYVDREMLTYVDRGQSVVSAQPSSDSRWARSAGAREQRINIEHVEIRDAHDEFSLTQQLRFLAAVQG